jgi:hypothetical protein
MKFDLVRPCAQCPFRRDVAPYLTVERVVELEDALTRQQQTFACHKTVDYTDDHDEDGESVESRPDVEEQHCAGAMILLEHLDRPNQMMRWMERLGLYRREKLDMDAPVYSTFFEMKTAHRKARRLRRKAKNT